MNQPKAKLPRNQSPAYPTGRRLQMASDGNECAGRGLQHCQSLTIIAFVDGKSVAIGQTSGERQDVTAAFGLTNGMQKTSLSELRLRQDQQASQWP